MLWHNGFCFVHWVSFWFPFPFPFMLILIKYIHSKFHLYINIRLHIYTLTNIRYVLILVLIFVSISRLVFIIIFKYTYFHLFSILFSMFTFISILFLVFFSVNVSIFIYVSISIHIFISLFFPCISFYLGDITNFIAYQECADLKIFSVPEFKILHDRTRVKSNHDLNISVIIFNHLSLHWIIFNCMKIYSIFSDHVYKSISLNFINANNLGYCDLIRSIFF